MFSDILTYTIRFQNTGNDTAFYVRLEDQLSNLLDWNTFEPVYASHPNEANLDQRTGLLKVIFNPIRLLDSTTNVIESQGFFTFKIKPRLPITENTILENFALIYFDYNKPIVTNTTKSVFVSTLVSIVQEEEFKCNFHPNPTNGLTFFTSTIGKPFKFFLYNNLGEEILYKDIQSSNFELDLSNYANGVYSFMIKLNNGFTSGKIVKF
ncbi:MAG: T9SS type A sorting domain-containing protein [Saprospiraceae bacterium]|nr:T9SS type A sorting domain-containing protein [Saprospiraceae bacterium]